MNTRMKLNKLHMQLQSQHNTLQATRLKAGWWSYLCVKFNDFRRTLFVSWRSLDPASSSRIIVTQIQFLQGSRNKPEICQALYRIHSPKVRQYTPHYDFYVHHWFRLNRPWRVDEIICAALSSNAYCNVHCKTFLRAHHNFDN